METLNKPQDSVFIEIAKSIGALVTDKNEAYGDSFSKSGQILRVLYPNGVAPNQYGDLLTVTRIIDKLFRVATRKDAFNESPWRDVCGYALLSVWRDNKMSAKSGCDCGCSEVIPLAHVEPDMPWPRKYGVVENEPIKPKVREHWQASEGINPNGTKDFAKVVLEPVGPILTKDVDWNTETDVLTEKGMEKLGNYKCV